MKNMIEVNVDCGCIIVQGEKTTSKSRLEQFLNTVAKPLFEVHGFTVSVIGLIEIEEETPQVNEVSYHPNNLWFDVVASTVSEGENKVATAIATPEFKQLAKDNGVDFDWYEFGKSRVMA